MSEDKSTIADRVRAALRDGKPAPALLIAKVPGPFSGTGAQPGVSRADPQGQCLLLDVSGSMAEHVEPGRSKWQALTELLPQFSGVARYAFSDACSRVTAQLPPASGGTDMANAFRAIKSAGIRHIVLITDGKPDDEESALRAANGLRIDILYVGPLPEPDFLARLAKSTGGTRQATTLKRATQAQIVAKARALLALPPGTK